jgi:DNA-binding IclR family transcriptional regulator
MTPFYGANDPPPRDVVPDWLVGGNRKRRVLTALADRQRERGWSVREVVDELACGRSTAYEIVRALRALNLLDEDSDGRLRLDIGTDLGKAIAALLDALEPFTDQQVDRPPRSRNHKVD